MTLYSFFRTITITCLLALNAHTSFSTIDNNARAILAGALGSALSYGMINDSIDFPTTSVEKVATVALTTAVLCPLAAGLLAHLTTDKDQHAAAGTGKNATLTCSVTNTLISLIMAHQNSIFDTSLPQACLRASLISAGGALMHFPSVYLAISLFNSN